MDATINRGFLDNEGLASYHGTTDFFWEEFSIFDGQYMVSLTHEQCNALLVPLKNFIKECEDGQKEKDTPEGQVPEGEVFPFPE